jgi:predicted lipoprotein with Yx(FWY)xxD motif
MRRSTIRFVAAAALAALTLAACSSSSKGTSSNTTQTTTAATTTTAAATTTTAATSGPKTVSLASTSLGQILVDGNGMTLYLDENDKPGKPACTAGCLNIWPPLAAPAAPAYGAGLVASKFSTVTASDGTKQLAVDGFPLYTFASDKKPGDVTGQGVGPFFVVGKNYQKIGG